MSDCEIGRYSRIRNAIIPPGMLIPENSLIGYDLEEDRARAYTITDNGVVAVPPGTIDGAEGYSR
jgi:glucose-1-phosphate adenylyltransferase